MPETITLPSILIVDDDPLSSTVVAQCLTQRGFEHILQAQNGSEALASLASQPVDLVIMDVNLPDMDGYQTTRAIRARHPDRHLPIILIGASNDARARTEGIDAGANDFLAKPLDSSELAARVTGLLTYRQALNNLESERHQLEALYRVGQALTRHLDYQNTIRELVSLAPQLFSATKAILVLLDEEGEFQQKIVAHPGENAQVIPTVEPAIIEKGLIGWVFKTGRPALVPDTSNDDRWAQLPDDEPQGSALAAALTWGNRIFGVLVLEAPHKDIFRAEHLSLITALCSQAAIALENSRLYEQMQREQKRADALITQIGTPIVIADSEGRIIRTNAAADGTFGLGADVQRKPLAEVFGLALADLLLRAQERGGTVSGAHSWRKAVGGERHSFNVSISPVAGVGYLLVWQDITGLKENERVRLESERAETQHVLNTFSRYMSTALIERVLNDRDILTRRERREAVVLFSDLRGFTRLTVEHPPDQVFALLNNLFSEMLEIVNRHEGLVFDITGDELMIAFNVPYTQPDSNRRALQTAIDMQRRFAELQRKWREQGLEVGMGTGINRGVVVLGHIGGSTHMNYAMVGETVNIAHRLVEIAEDTQIVVTPEILADGIPEAKNIRVVEMEPRLLKGKGQPQPMFMIMLENAGAAPPEPPKKKRARAR